MAQLQTVLEIMITNQHNQLLAQSRSLGWLAILCVMATLAVFVAAAVCAFVNPTAAILLTMILYSAPVAIISGAVLFWQCRKRQEQARELIAMFAEQVKHETAISVSTTIESATTRDKTKSQLSMQIARGAAVAAPRSRLISGLFRKLVGEGSV
jgi:hypothetical protein